MDTPLADNRDHVFALCSRLSLGEPNTTVTRVTGGLHHRMWRLKTSAGLFAVKQLSPDTLLDIDTRAHFNGTEATAEAFARHGIPAVFARSVDGDYLQVLDGIGYLVHPWCDARGLRLARVSQRHAVCVAEILARMHGLALDTPIPKTQAPPIPLEDNIEVLVDFAEGFHIELADTLRRGLPGFRDIAQRQPESAAALESHRVISHGDLDQKNVLWDAGDSPWLIDWECARWMNPTHETLMQSLNWSGVVGQFSPTVFKAFIAAYRQAGGVIDNERLGAAYQCVLGDWLNWLMYNVGRCMDVDEPAQRDTGQKQVALSLAALQHVMDRVPALLDLPDPLASGAA